jgi:hypothetical protein
MDNFVRYYQVTKTGKQIYVLPILAVQPQFIVNFIIEQTIFLGGNF